MAGKFNQSVFPGNRLTRSCYSLLLVTVLSTCYTADARHRDSHLEACYRHQALPLQSRFVQFKYEETEKNLYSGMEAWAHTTEEHRGLLTYGLYGYTKKDTVQAREKLYCSLHQYTPVALLITRPNDTSLVALSEDDFQNELFGCARYMPALLIDYALRHSATLTESDNNHVTYSVKVRKSIVALFVNRQTNLLDRVGILTANGMYGDMETNIYYEDYECINNLSYAQHIIVDKANGRLREEVTLRPVGWQQAWEPLLKRPKQYKWKEDPDRRPIVHTVRYNDYIYFIQLEHIHVQVMLVSFRDFLMVVSSPLNSRNGELIIAAARKLAPDKPIRYFSFGHRCQWVMGGIRPFIHKGATILCNTLQDEDFVTYLAKAPHILDPDSLQLHKKEVVFRPIKDSTVITDGKHSMHIYMIGSVSEHTNDYMLYYFPEDRLLWEEDLAWVNKKGEIDKARTRQLGLYDAITNLHLKVDTVMQSWGIGWAHVKTVFPFSDLERSVQLARCPKSSGALSLDDSLKMRQYVDSAFRQPLYAHARDLYLDSALRIKPAYAYLWQQKSNPTVKQRKYELAIRYLDSAVKYDPKKYLDYRGFTKCIFQKNYSAALADFHKAISLNGHSLVMDHSYDFFMGLCHLQLNNFDSAHLYISLSIQARSAKPGPDWVHPVEWFYFGIVQYEKEQYAEAIAAFDSCLRLYPRFPDPKYYKACCLRNSGNKSEAVALFREALEDMKRGYTFNEDSIPYERFPYQVEKYWLEYEAKNAVPN